MVVVSLSLTDIMSDSDTSTSASKYAKKMVSTRVLIRLVRERPCLWDRNDSNYRDKFFKEKSWQEIYREFEPSFESLNPTKKHMICSLITKKWYNVRDSYAKSQKPNARNRPYLYADDLQFLDTIYLSDKKKKKKKNENIFKESFEERASNEDETENNGGQIWMNEDFLETEDGVNESLEHTAKRPKLEYSNKEDCDESIVAVLANLIQKEEDEDRAFFKSITPAVKKLSENSKFEFRIQVMKLINSLKMREKQSLTFKVERVTDDVISDSD